MAQQPSDQDFDRRRRRTVALTFVAGVCIGVITVAWLAAQGTSGSAGFLMLLAITSLAAVTAAVVGLVGVLVDQVRSRTISRRRVVTIGGSLLAGFVGITLLAAASAAGLS